MKIWNSILKILLPTKKEFNPEIKSVKVKARQVVVKDNNTKKVVQESKITRKRGRPKKN